MASFTEELTSDVGLGNSDPTSHDPNLVEVENVIPCESTKLEKSRVSDIQDCSESIINNESEMGDVKRETGSNMGDNKNHSTDDKITKNSVESGEELHDETINKSEQIEDMVVDEVNTADPVSDINEDDKLLSEISEIVDNRLGKDDALANVNEAENEIDSKNNVAKLGDEENMEVDMESKMEGKIDETDVTSGDCGPLDPIEDDSTGNADVTSVNEMKKPKESAIQRLASLGLIPEEKPVVEDKDTILKKLASRGGISIMPAGSTPSSVSSVVISKSPLKPVVSKPSPIKPGSPNPGSVKSLSVKTDNSAPMTPAAGSPSPTTPIKPKYKPGPKSAKKKMKIDPGKSSDIDKDFNSLINFLSTGADVSSTSVTSSTGTPEEKTDLGETIAPIEKISESKPDTQLEVNEASNQSNNDGHGNVMDVDVNDDKSIHESEAESHDDSKCEQSPENDEITAIVNKNKNVIEEGSAEILLSSNKNVFYNKVQEFNRDMSIAALTVFSEMHQQDPRTRNRGKKRKAVDSSEADSNHMDGIEENTFEAGKKSENGITILEALSATGLRSIRYAREIPGVKEVIANDLSEDAVDTIKKNVEHNGVGDMVTTNMSDASLLMYQRQATQEGYDAIDLDPYGCPARFLDAAVQAVRDGGLLLVTCTDMAILAGNSPETCYVKYGAVSLRMPACHEMALRIALQCIESHANRYGRYIVPLLSFSADFYIRLIVQVYTSPVTCKKTTSKLAMVYQCVGCGTHSLHPLGNTSQAGHNSQPKFSLPHGPPVDTNCFHCHHKHNIGGPIWTAPLYSTKFVESMLKVVENGSFATEKRMQGMLEVIREELMDVPLYYTIAGLCSKLHCQAIPLIDIRSAILNAGYRVSSSHAAPTAVKTNAPSKVVWDIMRCWVHMNPVSQKRLVAGSVSAAIILEPPNLIANFDIHPRARPSSATRKLVRYQQNPEKNWGPGTRARCNNADDGKDEKRRLNQNKNKTKKHIEIIEVVTIDDEDETIEELKTTEPATTPSGENE